MILDYNYLIRSGYLQLVYFGFTLANTMCILQDVCHLIWDLAVKMDGKECVETSKTVKLRVTHSEPDSFAYGASSQKKGYWVSRISVSQIYTGGCKSIEYKTKTQQIPTRWQIQVVFYYLYCSWPLETPTAPHIFYIRLSEQNSDKRLTEGS